MIYNTNFITIILNAHNIKSMMFNQVNLNIYFIRFNGKKMTLNVSEGTSLA